MGLLNEKYLADGLLKQDPLTANPKMLAQALKARQTTHRNALTGQGLLDTAAIGLSPIPVIGDLLGLGADASRFYNEPESRTPLNFGLAALGLIPFVPPLVSAGLGKFAQSQGKTLAAPPTGPARNQAGAIVYHGSPHKFDAFDSSKIGTGEGAQAYGHGLYFAENPSVANQYKNDLGLKVPAFDGNPVTTSAESMLHDIRTKNPNADPKEIIDKYVAGGVFGNQSEKMRAELYAAADKYRNAKAGTSVQGSLYKVDLPDEAIAKMLDWDKPLSQQAPEVKGAVNKLYSGRLETKPMGPDLVDVYERGGGSLGVFSRSKVQDVLSNPADYLPYKGDEIYRTLTNTIAPNKSLTADKAFVSDSLKSLGIPGIRYLDGGSRGAGEGTRNFVVFPGNEGLLKILERQ